MKKASGELTCTELAAYDNLVQHGFYTEPVLDLILKRLAHSESIKDTQRRIHAYSILATLEKNRRRLGEARAYAEAGLNLARTNKGCDLNERLVYLLDQLGGIAAMEGDLKKARSFFEEEISVLSKHRETPQAKFHLVGAYRGLAAVLGALGDVAGAKQATAKSVAYAGASGNVEGRELASLQEFAYALEAGESPDPHLLDEIPTEHLIGRVMALNLRARALLLKNVHEEGERLLRLAYREAKRLQLNGEVGTAEATAAQFGIKNLT